MKPRAPPSAFMHTSRESIPPSRDSADVAAAALCASDSEAEPCEAFIEVLAADTKKVQAITRLVLGARSISSQLVDSANANVHLRALLTDVFLIDEAVGA